MTTDDADDTQGANDEQRTDEQPEGADPQPSGDADTDERPPPPQEEPVYNDRSKLDFDPDDGLFTGTAVDGNTDIPGPHENVDDVDPDDSGGSDGESEEDDES